MPALLAAMGVSTALGRPMSAQLAAPALDLIFKMLDGERPYRFGYDDQFLRQLIDMHVSRFGEMKDIRFLHHIVFINRTAGGHFGNLSRLCVAANAGDAAFLGHACYAPDETRINAEFRCAFPIQGPKLRPAVSVLNSPGNK